MGESNQRAALRVLARLYRVLESTDSGLTLPQYRMLTALSEGGERSARLADRLTIRKPTVTALADGLVAAGYMQRHSEPGDRRIVRLHITQAGRDALDRAEQAYGARLGPLLAEVPDQDQFVAALLAIGVALDRRAAAMHDQHESDQDRHDQDKHGRAKVGHGRVDQTGVDHNKAGQHALGRSEAP